MGELERVWEMQGEGSKKSQEEQRRDPETAGRLQVSRLQSALPLPQLGRTLLVGGRGATAAGVESSKWKMGPGGEGEPNSLLLQPRKEN